MSRAFDERIVLYFIKKVSTTTMFLFVMAILFAGVGYSRGTNNPFFIIGVMMFVMWLWQLIRTLFTTVKGTEVDESVERFKSNTNLMKNAYDALNLDDDEVNNAERIQLDGYCCAPIETEPLFRWDEEEQRVRSSNYQLSCFFLDKGVLLTYTEVKSLVDTEFYENSHIWRFAGITDVAIEKIPCRCRTSSKRDGEKVEKEFDVLTITGENGEKLSYAIGPNQMEIAEHIRDVILGENQSKSRLRKPVRKGLNTRPVAVDFDSLDKNEQKTLQVGLIGDELKDL